MLYSFGAPSSLHKVKGLRLETLLLGMLDIMIAGTEVFASIQADSDSL